MTTIQKQYRVRLYLISTGTLLGGSKAHYSTWFDNETDARDWMAQAIAANNPRNLDEVKITARIDERS